MRAAFFRPVFISSSSSSYSPHSPTFLASALPLEACLRETRSFCSQPYPQARSSLPGPIVSLIAEKACDGISEPGKGSIDLVVVPGSSNRSVTYHTGLLSPQALTEMARQVSHRKPSPCNERCPSGWIRSSSLFRRSLLLRSRFNSSLW